MSEPLAENVPYVGGPMDGKSCRLLYCESESVCMADATHHYRLVRVKGSGVATLVYAGSISTNEAATMSDENERSVALDCSVSIGEGQNTGEDEWFTYWYLCPKCDEVNIARSFSYCPNCGVKLQWPE